MVQGSALRRMVQGIDPEKRFTYLIFMNIMLSSIRITAVCLRMKTCLRTEAEVVHAS